MRTKINFGQESYISEYNYFLATGIDSAMPFFAQNKERDDATWESARGIEERVLLFRKYRPPSIGTGNLLLPLLSLQKLTFLGGKAKL